MGVPGQQALKGPLDMYSAINDFNTKKRDKLKGGYNEVFIDHGLDSNPAPADKKTDKKASKGDTTAS